jgi:hypothetical protein
MIKAIEVKGEVPSNGEAIARQVSDIRQELLMEYAMVDLDTKLVPVRGGYRLIFKVRGKLRMG